MYFQFISVDCSFISIQINFLNLKNSVLYFEFTELKQNDIKSYCFTIMYSQSKRSVSTLMATKTKVLMTASTAFIISTKNHPTDYHQREQPARNKEKSWSCGRCGPDCKPVAWNRSQSGVRSNQTFVVLSLCGRSGEGGYPCCGQYGSFHVFGSLTKSPEKVERDSCLRPEPPWENAGGPPHQHGGKNVFVFFQFSASVTGFSFGQFNHNFPSVSNLVDIISFTNGIWEGGGVAYEKHIFFFVVAAATFKAHSFARELLNISWLDGRSLSISRHHAGLANRTDFSNRSAHYGLRSLISVKVASRWSVKWIPHSPVTWKVWVDLQSGGL